MCLIIYMSVCVCVCVYRCIRGCVKLICVYDVYAWMGMYICMYGFEYSYIHMYFGVRMYL